MDEKRVLDIEGIKEKTLNKIKGFRVQKRTFRSNRIYFSNNK